MPLNGEELTLDDTEPNPSRVAGHWFFDNEGQFVPPQEDPSSYLLAAVESSPKQYSQQLVQCGGPLSETPSLPSNPKSLQSNHDTFGELLFDVDGSPAAFEKDFTAYLPIGNVPPIAVQRGDRLPGVNAPWRINKVRKSHRETSHQQRIRHARQNPPRTPQPNIESSVASTPDDQSIQSMDLSSPLGQLSLQNVPEQQMSQTPNNRLPASNIQSPISSSGFMPAFSPTNQHQYQYPPVRPSDVDLFARSSTSLREHDVSLPPHDYQQSTYQHPVYQQPMHQRQVYQQPTYPQPANQQTMGYNYTSRNLSPNNDNTGYGGMNHSHVIGMQQNSMQMTDMYGRPTPSSFDARTIDPRYTGYQPNNGRLNPSNVSPNPAGVASRPPTLTTGTTGSSAPVLSPPYNSTGHFPQYLPEPDPLLFAGLELPSMSQNYNRTWQEPYAVAGVTDNIAMEDFSTLTLEEMAERLNKDTDRDTMRYDGMI